MFQIKKISIIGAAYLLLFLPLLAFSESKQVRYAYLFDGAEFLKIDLSKGEVIQKASLFANEEFSTLLPASIKWGSVKAPEFDPVNKRLYYVATQPETNSDEKWKERILIVEFPAFKLVGQIDLRGYVTQSVNILLTPDGKRLLVSYDYSADSDDAFVYKQEVYDTATFKLVGQPQSSVVSRAEWSPEASRQTYFSAYARFSADGKTIRDTSLPDMGNRIAPSFCDLVIREGKVTREPFSLPEEVKGFVGYHDYRTRLASCEPGSALLVAKLWRKHPGHGASSPNEEPLASAKERVSDPVQQPISTIETRSRSVVTKGKSSSFIAKGKTPEFALYTTKSFRPFSVYDPSHFDPTIITMAVKGKEAYFVNAEAGGSRAFYIVNLEYGKQIARIDLAGFDPQSIVLFDR